MKTLLRFLLAATALISVGLADETDNKKSTRTKSMNFDEEVLESMNKNPMDFVENIAKNDRRKRAHLYQKRQNFKLELRQMTQEAGYTP